MGTATNQTNYFLMIHFWTNLDHIFPILGKIKVSPKPPRILKIYTGTVKNNGISSVNKCAINNFYTLWHTKNLHGTWKSIIHRWLHEYNKVPTIIGTQIDIHEKNKFPKILAIFKNMYISSIFS